MGEIEAKLVICQSSDHDSDILICSVDLWILVVFYNDMVEKVYTFKTEGQEILYLLVLF